jgi:hypothetical protein
MASHPTIADIKAAIARATRERQEAHAVGDASALAAAIRRQLTAKRRAGALLNADTAFKLGKLTEQCRILARLSAGQFDARVEGVARRAVAALAMPHRSGSSPNIRMELSEWFEDELGFPTRVITAIDAADVNARPQLEKRHEPQKNSR